MKNYFKKFSIMFVMLLALVLGTCVSAFATDGGVAGTTNLNNTANNSAKVGDRLTTPEKGWTRYDDKNYNITYNGTYTDGNPTGKFDCYDDDYKCILNEGSYASFKFIGNKIRIIGAYVIVRSNKILIEIDGVAYRYDAYSKVGNNQIIVFEKLDLENKEHTVKISIDSKTTLGDSTKKSFDIDAIDVVGKLVPYNESITLDKSTMNLTEGNSDKLTAITTPSALDVTWSSSDESIVTFDVDPTNGKIINVRANKEGTCTITATTTDGSNLSATCIVTVTKPSSRTTTVNPSGDITNSYGILNMSNPSGFTQNNNNGGNGNNSNNSGNTNNSGNSGNNYSNNNNSNSNNNYYYYNNYYISVNTSA